MCRGVRPGVRDVGMSGSGAGFRGPGSGCRGSGVEVGCVSPGLCPGWSPWVRRDAFRGSLPAEPGANGDGGAGPGGVHAKKPRSSRSVARGDSLLPTAWEAPGETSGGGGGDNGVDGWVRPSGPPCPRRRGARSRGNRPSSASSVRRDGAQAPSPRPHLRRQEFTLAGHGGTPRASARTAVGNVPMAERITLSDTRVLSTSETPGPSLLTPAYLPTSQRAAFPGGCFSSTPAHIHPCGPAARDAAPSGSTWCH